MQTSNFLATAMIEETLEEVAKELISLPISPKIYKEESTSSNSMY